MKNSKSLPESLKETAARFGKQKAIVFGSRVLNFESLDNLSDRIAGALSARSIDKGDRIGLYCPNSDAFVLAYFGILKAGATVVPINLLLNPKEIAYILNNAGAKALIYSESFAENVRDLSQLVQDLEFRVCIGSGKAFDEDIPWSALLRGSTQTPAIDFEPKEDVAVILYTSGTTGFPKGAMLTHSNLISNVESIWDAVKLDKGREVFLVVLPMFHAFAATASMLTPLLNGCAIVPLPRFDPEQTAKAIQSESASIFMGVPSMFIMLLKLPDEYTSAIRSLKYCISGGAAMPVEFMKQVEDRFGLPIHEGDGPTECSPVTCINPIGGKRKPGSVGLPVPRVEMKILNEQGKELPLGEVGEICVRGPNVMKGYWKNPEETKAAFFGEWFRTGDLGMKDEDGYFFIVDRKKDMIIVNGMNIYPRVVEEVLYKLPAVQEAAVVGEPHKLHGEIPVAYIALKDGSNATGAQVRVFCRDNLGRHEVPRKVFFLPELPKNAAGKILKRALRKDGELERGVLPQG